MARRNDADEPTLTLDLLDPGTELGDYKVEKLIGSGSMGMVYLATDRALNRQVALKLLRRENLPSAEQKKRFVEEARLLAQLNHPNIVTLYAIESFAAVPFMVMEYIDGSPLHTYNRTNPSSLENRLELALQIAEAILCAHENGIVHKDLKPSNILVTKQGRIKIVDFGLAGLLSVRRIKGFGTVHGTVHYMSPEQARGLNTDERSDLFTLGVVLYEMFTGSLPFECDTIGDTLFAILEHEPLPVCEIAGEAPLELQRIISRLMQKSPCDRYQSADELRTDLRFTLEAILSGRAKYPGNAFGAQHSIAVLPFDNLSDEPHQQYFCDGITEEITNSLSRVKGLQVVPRASTLAFRAKTQDLRDVGRKLHVDTLLQGSVRRISERVRVTAQLVDVATGYTLWSSRFDRRVDDIFAIQDDVAANVAQSLEVALSQDELLRSTLSATRDPTAYDYYLKGLHYYHQGRRKSFDYALRMYRKAVEADPEYAIAYAGIAETAAILVHLYGDNQSERLSEADRASRRALELDPQLSEALSARGFTLWLEGKIDEAKEYFESAMRQDPSLTDAPYLYGRACFQLGEFEKALELFKLAGQHQEHHESRYFAAQTMTALNRPQEALSMYRLALRTIERRLEVNPDDARAYTMGAVSLCRLGDSHAGLRWAEKALQIDSEDPGIQYNVACLYALDNQVDKALDCLERAVNANFAHREWALNDPDLAILHGNKRFQKLAWRS